MEPFHLRLFKWFIERLEGPVFFLVAALLLTSLVSWLKPDPGWIRETLSFFWLYMRQGGPGNVHVIQKRMFPDKMQADEFKTYVERHLPCEEERG